MVADLEYVGAERGAVAAEQHALGRLPGVAGEQQASPGVVHRQHEGPLVGAFFLSGAVVAGEQHRKPGAAQLEPLSGAETAERDPPPGALTVHPPDGAAGILGGSATLPDLVHAEVPEDRRESPDVIQIAVRGDSGAEPPVAGVRQERSDDGLSGVPAAEGGTRVEEHRAAGRKREDQGVAHPDVEGREPERPVRGLRKRQREQGQQHQGDGRTDPPFAAELQESDRE